MADSRKSKSRSRSKRSKRSHYDANDSDDSSNGAYYNSHNEDRRQYYSRSPEHHMKSHSHSSDRSKKNVDNPQMKSLVKVPIPSLLSPPSLLSSGHRNFVREAKVVQNKSGLDRKSQFARSLLDLHFEDHTQQHTPVYHSRNSKRRGERKSSSPFLSESFEKQSVNRSTEMYDEEETWLTPKETRKTLNKRSWREVSGGSAPPHSLFNSSYNTLVIESEPKKKVHKSDKLSPKPLLESDASSSSKPHTTQTTSRLSPANLPKRKSSKDPSSHARAGASDRDRHQTQHLDKIVCLDSGVEKNAVYLVIPSTLPWVHLHGRAKIEVVKGVVYILAHTLVPGTCYEVFSPSSSCLLSLQVDSGELCMSPRDVRTEIKELVADGSELDVFSEKSIGIIKVSKLDSIVCDYVTRLPPFTKLFIPRFPPKEWNDDRSLGVTLFKNSFKIAPESEMCDPCMAWDDLYNDALDKWLETIDKGESGDASPVLLTCGAKGAGKSTFNRCAVNTTLRTVPELAYIDCDVGQTEFSPPATVSLHIICKPVLSPPFCHQRHAEKMVFFGDVTPAHDPSVYVECLHSVFKAYRELAAGKKLPLLVNTMGFPEGIGYMLFIDTLNLARPDLVIQFSSEQPHGNFPPVRQEMIALDEGWTFNKSPPSDFKERLSQVKEHFLFMLPSLNFSETTPNPIKLHPADFRNLAMFSALSMGLSQRDTLMSLSPHTVPYRNLALHVCRYNLPPEQMLVAVDASIVALCEADLTQAKRHSEDLPLTFNDMPICDCLGIGIVRGVDIDKGLLYVSTTLPRHLLKRANTVLKGTLALPDHFIMNQKHIRHQVPYVDTLTQATAAHSHKPRNRMPRLHTKAKTDFGL